MTVARYAAMEERLPLITAPTLIIKPTEDPFSAPEAEKLAPHLPHARLVDLPGGKIPAPDQLPEEFAALVAEFWTTSPDTTTTRRRPDGSPAVASPATSSTSATSSRWSSSRGSSPPGSGG